MSKHILFVEDEPTQQDMFISAVSDWNKKSAESERTFTFDIAATVEGARSALDRIRCDTALFDLRVKSEKGGKAGPSGNDLARFALRQCGVPIAIVTANTGEIEEDVKLAGTVGIFDKNDEEAGGNYYDRALVWLGEQWDMMEILAAARRAMDATAADIFVLRLWPRWKMFAALETADRGELEQIVARQYVSHMADLLGLDDPDNVTWHPFENYMSPALMAARAHTGDIFQLNGELWVVLTPQCDMAAQKVDAAILAKCVQGIANWAEMVAAFRAQASQTSVEKSSKFLTKFVNQNLEPSRHFLPPLPGTVEPVLVHFTSVMTMPLDALNAALENRVASVSSPFLSNIVQRFGAYISRTGQPNIDIARF